MVKSVIERCKLQKGCFIDVEVKNNEDGSMDLCLPEISEQELVSKLPKVSVVTITKNRGEFAGLMLHNWLNIRYPRDKLEWIIVDDSDADYPYPLRDYIPYDDPSIKYCNYIGTHMRVDDKRNKAVELANYDYIAHMDDDDYYFPDGLLAKIRIMMAYNCAGVLSAPIGVYDLMERKSAIFMASCKQGVNTNDIPEATLVYKKSYWENNKFVSVSSTGQSEGRGFIGKHHNKFANVHFMFNMISITHTKNISTDGRRLLVDGEEVGSEKVQLGNFEDMFPKQFRYNLENVRKFIEKSYVRPE